MRRGVASSQHFGREGAAGWWRWARGWGAMILLPAAVLVLLPRDWPAWTLMWSLALAIFAGAKWLTWRRSLVEGAPIWLQAAYLFTWPGLNANEFLAPPRVAGRAQPEACPTPPKTAPGTDDARKSSLQTAAADLPSPGEWLFASAKLAFGIILLYAAVMMAVILPLRLPMQLQHALNQAFP